jgi:hypothetical protein
VNLSCVDYVNYLAMLHICPIMTDRQGISFVKKKQLTPSDVFFFSDHSHNPVQINTPTYLHCIGVLTLPPEVEYPLLMLDLPALSIIRQRHYIITHLPLCSQYNYQRAE